MSRGVVRAVVVSAGKPTLRLSRSICAELRVVAEPVSTCFHMLVHQRSTSSHAHSSMARFFHGFPTISIKYDSAARYAYGRCIWTAMDPSKSCSHCSSVICNCIYRVTGAAVSGYPYRRKQSQRRTSQPSGAICPHNVAKTRKHNMIEALVFRRG